MATKREQTYKLAISGPTLSLEDLRWIVSQAGKFKGTSKVRVKFSSDQRDGDYSEIAIDGEPEDIKLSTCRTYGTGGTNVITWNNEKR